MAAAYPGRVHPDSKDRAGRTPLSFTAENGNEAMVKLLLATGRVYLDSMDGVDGLRYRRQ
jgi:ankyrin repeat protein